MAETMWFLDTAVRVRVSTDAGSDGMSVIESVGRRGDSPPLHSHATEDEVFHVLEGTLRLVVDGREILAGPGDILIAPKASQHTYCVETPLARWLAITCKGDFERFVRALWRPAEAETPPPPGPPPTPEMMARLIEVAALHGIAFVGPPLTPATAAQ